MGKAFIHSQGWDVIQEDAEKPSYVVALGSPPLLSVTFDLYSLRTVSKTHWFPRVHCGSIELWFAPGT